MPSLTHLHHRSLISISGRDTFKYLQALTTNQLTTSTPPSAFQFTCFLNAQGRVLYDAFLYRTAESECLLETDTRNVRDLMDHLRRYKLRSKFTLRLLDPQELGIYALFQPSSPPSSSSSSLQETMKDVLDVVGRDSAVRIEDDGRAPGLGHRVLSPHSPPSSSSSSSSAVLVAAPLDVYTKHRYLHAVPEGPDEIVVGKALPMESNVDLMRGVHFHKGCYLGQELTVRTFHTGVLRKRIVPVRLYDDPSSSPSIPTPEQWMMDSPEMTTTTTTDTSLLDEENARFPSGEADDTAWQISIPTESGVKARPTGRVLARLGSLGLALLRLDKIGQPGRVRINGRELGVVGYRPTHWPAAPNLMSDGHA